MRIKKNINQLQLLFNSNNKKAVTILYQDIWNEYYKRIHYYVSSIIGIGNNNTEDLVQEIMFKVYEKLSSYINKYAFSTWIYTIARNHCYDFLRKKNTNSKFIVENFISIEESPEENVLKEELKNKIRFIINNLHKDEREIVFLYFYEKMSYKQIKIITDIPVGTIKYKMSIIKEKLKYELEDYYENEKNY